MSLIITANLGRLRAFRVKPSADLARSNFVIEEIDTPSAELTPQSISEMSSDQAGRFNSDGSPGMSIGEAHGVEREGERRIIAHLAERIDSLLAMEKPEEWMLAAPKAINARLVDSLANSSRDSLRENRPQDFAKLTANEVGKRFGVLG